MPTWAVVVAVYGGWSAVTWHFHALPWWLVLPLGAWLVAWHGSLQHETIHGHPTRNRLVNTALATPPLGLWLPYAIYRESHIAHHRDARITCPLDDPESFYVTPEAWARMGRTRRALLRLHNSLAGRLLLGPALMVVRLAREEAPRLLRGDHARRRIWLGHAVAVAALLVWVGGVCGIPLWAYVAFFAYPGLSLTLLRSFAEHHAEEQDEHRTAVIEAGPLLSLLFLNNNLHALHHARPGLPWYELPARYRRERATILARNGGTVYRGGYAELFRRFALRAKEEPRHPFADRCGRQEAAGEGRV